MESHSHQRHALGEGRVIHHRRPCREHFEITLELDRFDDAAPGQFVQLQCASVASDRQDVSHAASGVLLRRPFSIGGLRRAGSRCEIDVLGRIVGRGTGWLDRLTEGDVVSVLGPLGRPFTLPSSGSRAMLVAGGVGLPPIRWMGEALRRRGIACEAIVGAQTRDLLPVRLRDEPSVDGAMMACIDEFARDGIAASVTTDDGSCGLRGTVTKALSAWLERITDASSVWVYACGPEGMLQAVACMCTQRGVSRCEVAMERTMGCGMGVCQSCVLRVRDDSAETGWRYALCCAEGPVFDAKDILWRSSGE